MMSTRLVATGPVPQPLDATQAIERLFCLLSIPGKSGGEGPAQEWIRSRLSECGIPQSAIANDQAHRRSPIGGEVGNLIVTLPGTLRAPRRMLMAHLDTVPLCVGAKPVRRGQLVRSANPKTALGGDNRAGASVILTAALEILRQGLPHPPLTFFWPVQEEIGLLGARYVSLPTLKKPKLCFNWDGSSATSACIGATGAYDLEIEIEGIASHAGVHPEAGVSAIAVASLAISELQKAGWHGLVIKGKETGTSNLGIISGGDATNVVTSHVRLRGEVRSHDRRFRQQLVKEFRQAFERAVASVRNSKGRRGKLHFQAELKYESFQLSEKEPCVREALQAIAAAGLTPQTRISNGGLDANWLTAHGLPTVTLGCGQQNVHTIEETLDLNEYLHACRIALHLATQPAG